MMETRKSKLSPVGQAEQVFDTELEHNNKRKGSKMNETGCLLAFIKIRLSGVPCFREYVGKVRF